MHDVTIRKNLGHPWTDLFPLVLDIERYPQFVPGCTRVSVLSRQEAKAGRIEIVSRMTVGLLPVQISYTNLTVADQSARRISVESTDGPLRHLHVLWRFEPAGDSRTLIAFTASYQFRNPIVAHLADSAFGALFGQIVDAFEHRADRVLRPAHAHP